MIKAGVGEGWGEPPQRASLAPARLPSGVASRVRAMPAGWVEEGVESSRGGGSASPGQAGRRGSGAVLPGF